LRVCAYAPAWASMSFSEVPFGRLFLRPLLLKCWPALSSFGVCLMCDFGRSAGRPMVAGRHRACWFDWSATSRAASYDWWTNLPGRAPVKHAFEVVGSVGQSALLFGPGSHSLRRSSSPAANRDIRVVGATALESVDGQSSLDDYWSCGAKRIVWADANSRGKRAHSISLWR